MYQPLLVHTRGLVLICHLLTVAQRPLVTLSLPAELCHLVAFKLLFSLYFRWNLSGPLVSEGEGVCCSLCFECCASHQPPMHASAVSLIVFPAQALPITLVRKEWTVKGILVSKI